MAVDKRLQKLSKKGAGILGILTKTEADLTAHVAETESLVEQIEQEIQKKYEAQTELKTASAEYGIVLDNIRTLLGKD